MFIEKKTIMDRTTGDMDFLVVIFTKKTYIEKITITLMNNLHTFTYLLMRNVNKNSGR